MLTNEEELLCKVVRSKYGSRDNDSFQFAEKQRATRVRKGMIWGAELLKKGIRWSLRMEDESGLDGPLVRRSALIHKALKEVEEDPLKASISIFRN